MIDLRFGHGTWQGIVDERARRMREAKEAARQERIKKQKKRDAFYEMLTMALGVIILSAVAIGMAWLFVKGVKNGKEIIGRQRTKPSGFRWGW